jgi:outer membrane protein TolC
MGLWGDAADWQAEPRLPELPSEPIEVSNLEARSIAASIDLALLRQEIETTATQAGVRNLEALIGDLELGGTAERDDREWEAGPTLSIAIPLFDQGQARRAGARAELNRKLEEYYARAVEVRSIARDGQRRLQTARERVRRYRDVVLPLEAGVGAELQLQYNAMQIGVFDLLAAKERQIETGARYIQALRDYWLAHVALSQILNGRPPPGGLPSGLANVSSGAAAAAKH